MEEKIKKSSPHNNKPISCNNCPHYSIISFTANFYQPALLAPLSNTKTFNLTWSFNPHLTTSPQKVSFRKWDSNFFIASFVVLFTSLMFYCSHFQQCNHPHLLMSLHCTFFISPSFQSLFSGSSIILDGNSVNVPFMLQVSVTQETIISKELKHVILILLKLQFIWEKKLHIGTWVHNFGSEDVFMNGLLSKTSN